MKKIYVILTSIVVGLLLIITSGTIVKADSSYDITNYDMNINVSEFLMMGMLKLFKKSPIILMVIFMVFI